MAERAGGQPKVELRDVGLRYFGVEGETEAIKGVSLKVASGEFVAIIGQSGCGKSTLLSLISGILTPTEGQVRLDGPPVAGPSRKVGYMLQQDYLFEWRTILENAVLGAEKDPRSRAFRQLGFWKQALDGLPEELGLPGDRPRPLE